MQLPCLLLANGIADGCSAYESAVTRAIMLGGCNASRSAIVGAAAAAAGSLPPVHMTDKVERKEEILQLASCLANRN